MAEFSVLKDIVVIFTLAVGVLLLFHKLKVPPLLGFIFTGMLAGPNGLKIVQGVHQVELLAEIGVILLLFTIGMEFSYNNLVRIRRTLLIAGPIQVGLCTGITLLIMLALKQPFAQSLLVGFLVTLSSTVVIMKLLQERGDIDKPVGQISLAVAIFQDMAAVPMMLIMPLLAGSNNGTQPYLLLSLALGLVILVATLVGSQLLVPKLLFQIANTRSRELFLLSIIVICFAVAFTASLVGMSLALGAFLAGLIISRSEYSHNALGNILPFRDVFSSFFFVSIGMLFDIRIVLDYPVLVIGLTLAVIVGKTLMTAIGAMFTGYPAKTAIIAGLGLSQVGEFSFIIAQAGMTSGLLSDWGYQLFLAVSVLTMGATPFLVQQSDWLAEKGSRLPIPKKLRTGRGNNLSHSHEKIHDHLVVIGFGLNGRNLVRSAKAAGVRYQIIEMNPETVRAGRLANEPIVFGDATHEAVLESVHVSDARIIAIVIDDPTATRRIIEHARNLNPTAYIIARTRYLKEMKPLLDIGATEVIPEEFETSIEIFTRVLRRYMIPRSEIDRFVAEVRADHYQILRSPALEPTTLATMKMQLSDLEVDWLLVEEGSRVEKKTLADLHLRKSFALTVLLIRRGNTDIPHPDPELPLEADDIVFVLGKPEDVARAHEQFSSEYSRS